MQGERRLPHATLAHHLPVLIPSENSLNGAYCIYGPKKKRKEEKKIEVKQPLFCSQFALMNYSARPTCLLAISAPSLAALRRGARRPSFPLAAQRKKQPVAANCCLHPSQCFVNCEASSPGRHISTQRPSSPPVCVSPSARRRRSRVKTRRGHNV